MKSTSPASGTTLRHNAGSRYGGASATALALLTCLLTFAFIDAHSATPPTDNQTKHDITEYDSLSRPVTGVYGVESGSINALSTYLSPLPYKGADIGIYGTWSKAMPFAPASAIMTFDSHASMGRMENPAHTALMLDLDLDFNWGMGWRKRLPSNFQVTCGGNIDANGGLLWLPRNGNNPVAARAFINLGADASISWRWKIGRLPVLFSDRARLPLAGIFFSPEYGETYYEIYLGNHSGLARFGYPGNHFSLSNLFSVNLDFGRTAMQVGYRFEADTSWASHINTHIFRHFLVIGVIPGGLGMKGKQRVNNALY